MTKLFVYFALALGVSFVCSILEAALLSVTPSHIAKLEQDRPKVGSRLRALKSHIDRPLAAILNLNTIANTAGAAGVGAEAQRLWGSEALAIASAIWGGGERVSSAVLWNTILLASLGALTAVDFATGDYLRYAIYFATVMVIGKLFQRRNTGDYFQLGLDDSFVVIRTAPVVVGVPGRVRGDQEQTGVSRLASRSDHDQVLRRSDSVYASAGPNRDPVGTRRPISPDLQFGNRRPIAAGD